ncbi:lyase family protein [Xylophilus sp. Leaf220]|uniref:lyase family protein n=1 Tax=Xylophilus sp. Leaf220 TaxID=1735686 RepID=UPI0006F585F8|nr:lyase family protein [Xylophilus sp. Leaf220]KQM79731.1 3-carboxy-cis,cis-muconate cycloisomerase [Xylophilus sp. Leaf220]
MSSLFDDFLSTDEALEAFSPPHFVAAMLRFEVSLARAQAQAGLVPAAAAEAIAGQCHVESFDVAQIVRDSGRAGSVAIPLLKALKERVGAVDAAATAFTHFGSTSQDVIDTAAALVTRPVLDRIDADGRQLVAALLDLAERHAAMPVLARTLGQPGSVTSFGWKCAQWAAPIARSLLQVRAAAAEALAVQLGGAVGTQAQMAGKGPAVVALMAADLGLAAPDAPWHTQRDRWVTLGCALGVLVGSVGKLARDLALMGQYEVGEVAEPSEPGRGGSSAMPHKRNPVASMVALAAAHRAPQCVAALLAAMPQEQERALGAWQAELAAWPALLQSAHGAVRALAQAVPGLQVHGERMRANLDRLRAELPPAAAEEWFAPALADHAAGLAREQAARLRTLLAG